MQSSDKGQYAESWTQADFSLLTGSEALAKSKLRGASAGPGVNTGSMSGRFSTLSALFLRGHYANVLRVAVGRSDGSDLLH